MTTIEEYELLLSSISHELRNPATLINSYLQLLESLHPEVTGYSQWQPIREETAHLITLLKELSTLRASSQLRLTYVDTESWFADYAVSARLLTESLASEKISANHSASTPGQIPGTPAFRYIPETPLPPVCLDPLKLRQVLDNLIRNAADAVFAAAPSGIKKAAADENTITLRTAFSDGFLRISVSDTGCGISPDDMKDIFQPFVTHKKNGTGVGLAICKRIIEAHGGTISVCSAAHEGTTFTLLLPADGKEAAPE